MDEIIPELLRARAVQRVKEKFRQLTRRVRPLRVDQIVA